MDGVKHVKYKFLSRVYPLTLLYHSEQKKMALGFDLDYQKAHPGYYAFSAWPVECGGNRRQKITHASLNLREGERLTSLSRHSGGWAVMFIQRGPGEIFLQCGGTTVL